MTKQEQISEMAKIIDNRLIEARGYLGSMNKGEGYWIAQKLIEHYQPKLPKDSVVLTKDELKKLGKYVDITEDVKKEFQRELMRVRKETAREYHDKFAEVIRERDYAEGYAEIGMNEENDEILKSFGVEVEE